MKQWMELIDYQITEGSEFGWNCFGYDSYRLEHWRGEQESPSFSILFDKRDHTVYQMEAHDYINNRAYRWTAPSWKTAYEEESSRRGVRVEEAWDNVDYVELETLDDFFEKASAIYRGEDYDTRVSVPVEFSDEELLKYMKIAHERDITFNQLITEALTEAIEGYKRDPEGMKQRAQRWKDEKDFL